MNIDECVRLNNAKDHRIRELEGKLAQAWGDKHESNKRAERAEQERDEWMRKVGMAQLDMESFYEPQLQVARESRKRIVALARRKAQTIEDIKRIAVCECSRAGVGTGNNLHIAFINLANRVVNLHNESSNVVSAFERLGKCEDEFGQSSRGCGEYTDA